MVSKMCRGYLTAGMLAIGVTVVLISEIDTYCHTLSAWIWYSLSVPSYKKNATNGRLPGNETQKTNWEVLQLLSVVKSAHLQFRGMHVLSTGFAQAWKVLEYTGVSWKILENYICLEKYLKNTQRPWKVLEFYQLQEDSTVFWRPKIVSNCDAFIWCSICCTK